VPEPVDRSLQTRASLAADLARLGVRPGQILLVHTSVSALGWVAGGAMAVAQALLDALGPAGTLVVPTQTGANSDPAGWSRPPVPPDWWQPIRDHLPGYDPARTPTRGMGAVPELVRTWPGAVRSAHPVSSLAALGPAAAGLMGTHDLGSELGERSPLAALEAADARVLLLGAGWDSCTAFHLAEYRVPGLPRSVRGCAVRTERSREWVTYEDVDLDADDFADLGAAYQDSPDVLTGAVGDAICFLFPVRSAVTFATRWLAAHRSPAPS
jgi:aminoglycoside 3-N-acetyltransferase